MHLNKTACEIWFWQSSLLSKVPDALLPLKPSIRRVCYMYLHKAWLKTFCAYRPFLSDIPPFPCFFFVQVSFKENSEGLHLKLDKQFSLELGHGAVTIRCSHVNRHGGQPSARTIFNQVTKKTTWLQQSSERDSRCRTSPQKARRRQEQQIYLESPHYTGEQTSSRFWENTQNTPSDLTTCGTDQNHT